MGFWLPYFVSVMIGLLVGIERERAHGVEQSILGVRSFTVLAILGAVAGGLSQAPIALICVLFAMAVILIGTWRAQFSNDPSVATVPAAAAIPPTVPAATTDTKDNQTRQMTTTLAAGAVFFLCFNSHQQPGLTAFIGPLVALVLFAKKPLHHFTHKIRSNELEAAILLILLGVGVVDILVDQPADSWGLINPKKFGTIVLALATLEFVSYLAVRFLGPRKSTLVIGGLGGFVSSTAVLMTNAKDAATHPDEWRKHLIITWVAQIAALCEMLVIVAWISPELALAVLPAIGSGVAISIVIYGLLNWRQQETMHSLDKMKSPLNLKGVLRLAVLLALILGAVGAAQKLIGPAATQTLAFLAGLFDLHGITLATSTMVSQHQLSLEVARDSIVIAALASFFSKTVLAWMLSGWQHRSRFALTFSVLTVALAAIVAAVNWLSIFS